jgi:hypothetical protein
MTHDEAKFILQAYRPGGHDANDATFCAALELARQDPVLRAWYERHQAFDRAVAAKLRAVTPPADLRSAILTGGRVSGAATAPWWRQPRWLAVAASMALLLTVGTALWPKAAEAQAPFMDFVLNDARHSERHGGEGGHNAALQAQLGNAATHLGGTLVTNFDTLRTTGCRSLTFQGHSVLEVCFKRDGKWFHCYVVRKTDFPYLTMPGSPEISEHGRLNVASWADNTNVYLVVSKVGREALEKLI